MNLQSPLPACILGGDPFNQFRFLYRRELWWKLNDPEYCLSVMRAAYEAGCTAYDLSFEQNVRLFEWLQEDTGGQLTGFGNPTWEQGVLLRGRYLQYERDRILKTLVDRLWPRRLAHRVQGTLSKEALMVFGYDQQAVPLTDEEIGDIELDDDLFRRRTSILSNCRYMFFGGSDADWLVSLGRADLLHDLARAVRQQGHLPILLCHYATLVLPKAIEVGLDCEAVAIPVNRSWAWFDHSECVELVRRCPFPVIAFMPLASGQLRRDVAGALAWLFQHARVESILFGTATRQHAAETVRLAAQAKQAALKAEPG